ncbi:MAG: EAL domain-containing protein [Stigonema ocellatum SAG 48.90 = DSM 106950]|nr:EAL domain-containing protein [Stigonema ocellatum SAG 48.90 = DSM 106950]
MSQQQEPEAIKKNINLGKVKIRTAQQREDINHLQLQACYLHNFLEPYESFISQLIAQLQDDNRIIDSATNNSSTNAQIGNRILEIVRKTSKADFVFVLRNETQDNWFVKSQSDLADRIDEDVYIEILKSNILPNIWRQSVFNPAYHGVYQIYEDRNGDSHTFVFVPLILPPKPEIMVVCGVQGDSYLLGDAYGRILSTFYQASQILPFEPDLVEAAIIDDLKKDFGFVSASLYERRFQLFCGRLQRMVVYFEPVLHLDPEDLFISGWEALARNPDNLRAPSDLFQAAQTWGPQFTIELDQYFLRVAIQTYLQARKKSKQARADDAKPLSVNVYPDSLMGRAYFETVRQILQSQVIQPRNLILEISEKVELPVFQDGIRLESPINFFKKKLLEYVKLKIRFAIDDFGVGHASVSRLAGLNPCHVKIDREILHHEHSDVIIRFVHELVGANNLNPSNVIVEGVDETVPISLSRLKEIGVSYIQGYIVGKPSPEIYRLSQKKANFLKKLILDKTI